MAVLAMTITLEPDTRRYGDEDRTDSYYYEGSLEGAMKIIKEYRESVSWKRLHIDDLRAMPDDFAAFGGAFGMSRLEDLPR